ncbi:MAG TPA: DUF4199 domain-containing protein [Flavisolibacter sp.]
MKKTVLTFGLVSGIIIILYSVAVFLVFGDFSKMAAGELATVEQLGYLRYIILLLTVIFALRYYKQQHGGHATFKQLFLAGLYTVLLVAALVGMMELVYMLINPEFMNQYAELSTRRMQEQGASADQIRAHQQQMESYKWMANPVAMGLFYFFETAVLGTIMSLATAAIMRSRRPSEPGYQPAA